MMNVMTAQSLDQRLGKWRTVEMPFDSSGLNPRELRMIEKLIEASRCLDSIFWRQCDPDALELYKTSRDPKMKRLLMIHGTRFDLIDDHHPFAGTEPMPPGRGLYPVGLTREQIEQYVVQHPEKKEELYNPYTVVDRRGDELVGRPYHEVYRPFLEPMTQALREAAELSEDEAFTQFLLQRADSLLVDDYYASDLLWVDLKDPKFDVVFAPYETYLDDVLGVKTSYGSAVLIRNDLESQRLAMYQRYIPDIQDALPLPAEDRPSKRGHVAPMEVMDAPFRAGDLRHGYQAVADNLPNDPRIHQEKGSKKIFFKNFMDARVEYVILPIAKKLMREDQAAKVSGEGYVADVVLHEISHGLGPAFARRNGRQLDIRESIGPIYSGLEEAKADVVGMFGLKWLVDRGVLPADRLEEYYASYVAGIFRTLRFGTAEAHGRAEMMEFNYLSQEKAIHRDPATGRYVIDYVQLPIALARVSKELLEIEATGDRARAENWFKRYEAMPSELRSALEATTDIPVDIDPVFSFADRVE
jgi:Peptidase family M49